MSENIPLVTVLLSVYNGEKYLKTAIDSILSQSFKNFEFLIINDGSSDNTEGVIKSYSDSRISYIRNESNLKLIASLNKGLSLAKGKYIARMDADDISIEDRLEKQVSFLENNSEIGICGSYIEVFGPGISTYTRKYPLEDVDIRLEAIMRSPFAHPTVMIRKKILDKYNLQYSKEYLLLEDYKLWTDLLNYTQGMNLPEVLLKYRSHLKSVTKRDKPSTQFFTRRNLIRQDYVKNCYNLSTPVLEEVAKGKINRYNFSFLAKENKRLNKFPERALNFLLVELFFLSLKEGVLYRNEGKLSVFFQASFFFLMINFKVKMLVIKQYLSFLIFLGKNKDN